MGVAQRAGPVFVGVGVDYKAAGMSRKSTVEAIDWRNGESGNL